MNRTRELVESSLLVAMAAVLFLAGHLLPVVGMAFALVCPAPLVVLGLRHSYSRAVLGVAAASVLVFLFSGVTGAVFFALGFGVLGVGLGILSRRFDRAVDILLYGVIISLGSKLLLMVVVVKITGINPFSLDPEELTSVMDRVFGLYQGVGMSESALETAREQMTAAMKMLPLIFPALLTMASAVDCFLSYVVSGAVLKRLGRAKLPPVPPFGQWRFPKSLFWALIASLVLHLLGGASSGDYLARAGLNLRLLVTALFFVQGLSVVWCFMTSKGLGPVLRTVLAIVILVVTFLAQIVLLLGIIDMWFDLRSRIRRRDDS